MFLNNFYAVLLPGTLQFSILKFVTKLVAIFKGENKAENVCIVTQWEK